MPYSKNIIPFASLAVAATFWILYTIIRRDKKSKKTLDENKSSCQVKNDHSIEKSVVKLSQEAAKSEVLGNPQIKLLTESSHLDFEHFADRKNASLIHESSTVPIVVDSITPVFTTNFHSTTESRLFDTTAFEDTKKPISVSNTPKASEVLDNTQIDILTKSLHSEFDQFAGEKVTHITDDFLAAPVVIDSITPTFISNLQSTAESRLVETSTFNECTKKPISVNDTGLSPEASESEVLDNTQIDILTKSLHSEVDQFPDEKFTHITDDSSAIPIVVDSITPKFTSKLQSAAESKLFGTAAFEKNISQFVSVDNIEHIPMMTVLPETVKSALCEDVYVIDTSEDCGISTISHNASLSGSEGAHTPNSIEERLNIYNIPEGLFADPENNIEELRPDICDGKVLPRVLIPSDIWAEAVENNVWRETIFIPAQMGGILIGRFGKNVRDLKTNWQAEISLSLCPDRQDILLLNITCPLENKDNVLDWLTKRFKMRPSRTPIGNPNQLRRFLPLGVPTKVHVRTLYGLKDFFISIRDSNYDKFLEMQEEMNKDYSSNVNFRMQLCAPITSGTVAVLPHEQGYARALLLKVFTHSKHTLYFLLDYGTFGVIELSELRKIRVKYMHTHFQAIHATWAHAWPVFSDIPDLHVLRTYFSSGQIEAHAIRMETCCKASVVFTDSAIVPVSSTNPVPSSTAIESVPGCNPTKRPVDILSLACSHGLYMINPLVIYPSRQIWLNATDKALYVPSCTDVDYNSLVSYATETASGHYDPSEVYQKHHCGGNQQKKFRQSNGGPGGKTVKGSGKWPKWGGTTASGKTNFQNGSLENTNTANGVENGQKQTKGGQVAKQQFDSNIFGPTASNKVVKPTNIDIATGFGLKTSVPKRQQSATKKQVLRS